MVWLYKVSSSFISVTSALGGKRWYIDLKSHFRITWSNAELRSIKKRYDGFCILSDICYILFVMKMPSVVPRPLLNPCCCSSKCVSYQSDRQLRIMGTMILQSVEPEGLGRSMGLWHFLLMLLSIMRSVLNVPRTWNSVGYPYFVNNSLEFS